VRAATQADHSADSRRCLHAIAAARRRVRLLLLHAGGASVLGRVPGLQSCWRSRLSKRPALVTATVASPGGAALSLNARVHAVGLPARVDLWNAGESSGVKLVVRPLVVARCESELLHWLARSSSSHEAQPCLASTMRCSCSAASACASARSYSVRNSSCSSTPRPKPRGGTAQGRPLASPDLGGIIIW